jgi:hypothetical protein
MTRFFFSVWQLRVSFCGVPSLTRGWVCNLLVNCFWALPEWLLWGPSPAELRQYFTVSFETPSTRRARSLYLYSPGTGWPSYTPVHWVPFSSPLTTRRWYSNPPPHGFLQVQVQVQVQVRVRVQVILRPTVSWPICLGIGHPSGVHDQIFVYCLTNAGFLLRGRAPLWREDGFVIYSYNCFWALPELSLTSYFTVLFETPPTWRTRPLYLYHPGTGWPSYTPWHWVPFSSPLTTRRATVEVFQPTSTWLALGSGYFATDGQSASLSWYRAPIWGSGPDFYYYRTFAVFMLRVALPDERTGL